MEDRPGENHDGRRQVRREGPSAIGHFYDFISVVREACKVWNYSWTITIGKHGLQKGLCGPRCSRIYGDIALPLTSSFLLKDEHGRAIRSCTRSEDASRSVRLSSIDGCDGQSSTGSRWSRATLLRRFPRSTLPHTIVDIRPLRQQDSATYSHLNKSFMQNDPLIWTREKCRISGLYSTLFCSIKGIVPTALKWFNMADGRLDERWSPRSATSFPYSTFYTSITHLIWTLRVMMKVRMSGKYTTIVTDSRNNCCRIGVGFETN